MDMSLDDNNIPPDGGHHHPGPLHLPRDPSTDIPNDPDLAESHYLDVDDFEADESESEVHLYVHAEYARSASNSCKTLIGVYEMHGRMHPN